MAHNTTEFSLPMGQQIRKARLAQGMTLAELGSRLGITPQAVHKWEHGINYPDITLIPRLAHVLSIPLATLFSEDE